MRGTRWVVALSALSDRTGRLIAHASRSAQSLRPARPWRHHDQSTAPPPCHPDHAICRQEWPSAAQQTPSQPPRQVPPAAGWPFAPTPQAGHSPPAQDGSSGYRHPPSCEDRNTPTTRPWLVTFTDSRCAIRCCSRRCRAGTGGPKHEVSGNAPLSGDNGTHVGPAACCSPRPSRLRFRITLERCGTLLPRLALPHVASSTRRALLRAGRLPGRALGDEHTLHRLVVIIAGQ